MTRPRTKPPDEVKPVSVSLTPELVNRLDAAARRQQVSRSLLVREFVQAGLDKLDAEPAEPPRSPVQVCRGRLLTGQPSLRQRSPLV